MQKITTFLTFNDQALPAAELYTSIFGGKILSKSPGPIAGIMTVEFELFGQTYIALNGGPSFTHSEGFSLFVSCEDQAEIDELWTKLTSNGGKENRCGWCLDKFGVSWQVIPKNMGQLLSSPAAVQAMLKMNKLDIATLAAAGK